MKIIKASNLTCPIDEKPLEAHEKQLGCGNGHTFDIARQGYVNLLPVQHKRSKSPGDSKEMVSARTRFLNAGIYKPVANKLAEIVSAQINGDTDTCLLDAGCGEGYYLNDILNHLKTKDGKGDLSFIGLDISKPAIAEAAKRNKQITWIVGTNRQPPIACASVDIIVCVFGFQSFEGFSNVLKPGGKVILVEPGPDHLKEMREVIYAEVKKSDPQEISGDNTTGFQVVDTQPLHFKTSAINAEHIQDLLLMTPHFYRASQEGRAAAGQLKELNLTVDMVFRTLENWNSEELHS
ncbi:Ribosomal RNA large subunit methyltransferase A [hydrothermal vent metagenome]|uniref:Ribosomal RNA large subunit methyltransferase A n=1 Tax=hydrothermal vent metagenome TaxID=652676 RepID=A0A3B0YQ20_9ZZZZ